MLHKMAASRPRLLASAVVVLLAGIAGITAFRAYRTPAPLMMRLPDGTEVFYLSNSKIVPAGGYPNPRELKIDGEAFIRAAALAQPLTIRTRLMVLTVTGESALRVTAHSDETGEETDVLSGQVVARKAYPSQQNEPDTLAAGDEVMVNETIDLQEKETTDVPSLRSWSEALMTAAARRHER